MTRGRWLRSWRGWLHAARIAALSTMVFVVLGGVDYISISGEWAYPTGTFSLTQLFMFDTGPWRGPIAWFGGGLTVVLWAVIEKQHRTWSNIVRLILAMLATAAFFVLDFEIFDLGHEQRLLGAFLADLSVTVFFAASIALATSRPPARPQ